MLHIIPRPVHAVLDYLYGATALMTPKVVGFEDNSPAKVTGTVIGVAALLSGLTTRHEGGVVKLLSFNTHLKLDMAGAALALAAPWLLGFSHHTRARNTIIGLAILEAAVAMLSQPDEPSAFPLI
jgi:hypothetical protein